MAAAPTVNHHTEEKQSLAFVPAAIIISWWRSKWIHSIKSTRPTKLRSASA